jgi:hypothetical protein
MKSSEAAALQKVFLWLLASPWLNLLDITPSNLRKWWS